MATLYSQYESGLQLTAGVLTGSVLGTSGLNPIVDRLNSISTANSLVTGSLVSGTSLVVSGTGVISGTAAKFYGTSTASATVPGILEIATSAETQTGTDATRAVSPDGAFDVIPPVGGVVAWIKSMVGVPQTLPAGWVECNGATISDGESPMNGQAVPDLNGNEFLRGAATSGGIGGGTTGAGSSHTHSQSGSVSNHTLSEAEMPTHSHVVFGRTVTASANTLTAGGASIRVTGLSGSDADSGNAGSGNGHDHNDTFSNGNESSHTHASQPKFYDVVWIIRIK